MTTQQEKLFLIIWKANSATPGLIETIKYKESELAVHNKDEVLGPFREYVELIPGSNLDRLMYNAGDITEDDPLFDVNIGACTWNWETNDLNLVYKPELNWDDIRAQRNVMLAAGDNMFNFDTPDPLKTDWVEHRALLRDLINREQAAGRTPKTVFWLCPLEMEFLMILNRNVFGTLKENTVHLLNHLLNQLENNNAICCL